MNKKVIIGIIAGVLALALIAVAAVLIIKSIDVKEGGSGSASGLPSTTESSDSSTGSADSSSGQSGNSASSDKPIKGGSIGIEDVSASVGDTVKIPITIAKNPGIFAAQFYFEYDAEVLEYVDYEEGKLLDEYDVVAENGVVNCIISGSALKDVSDNGTIITLVFDVKDGAKAGDYEIKVGDKTLICNLNEQPVTPEIANGKVTVK